MHDSSVGFLILSSNFDLCSLTSTVLLVAAEILEIQIYISRKQTPIDRSISIMHSTSLTGCLSWPLKKLSRTVPWIAVGDWGSSDHIYIYILVRQICVCMYYDIFWRNRIMSCTKVRFLSTDIYNSCVLRLVHECSSSSYYLFIWQICSKYSFQRQYISGSTE